MNYTDTTAVLDICYFNREFRQHQLILHYIKLMRSIALEIGIKVNINTAQDIKKVLYYW